MGKKILFMVGSPYQLFNAITLRLTVCAEDSCDLVLRSAIHWNEDVLARLKEAHLFGTVHRPDFTQAEAAFWQLSQEEKSRQADDPLLYFGQEPVPAVYDVMYAALDSVAWKLIYRYHIMNGKDPEIIQFDEGTRSYTLDLASTDDKPYFQGAYGQKPYAKAIKAFYLHRPELYSVEHYGYELLQMPNPSRIDTVKAMLIKIFGYEPLPEDTYIYFEDYFFPERHISNDMQLFESIAAIVGKENITVKTHPRSDLNRFERLGYKTVGKTNVPWEVQMLGGDIRRKVLISVTSTSILTPYVIFDSDIHVISLKKCLPEIILFTRMQALRRFLPSCLTA